MSFLKKKGQEVWVPEVKGRKYIPGYWYTYTEYVSKYVPGESGGGGPIYGAKPKPEVRYVKGDFGFSGSSTDFSTLILDY